MEVAAVVEAEEDVAAAEVVVEAVAPAAVTKPQ